MTGVVITSVKTERSALCPDEEEHIAACKYKYTRKGVETTWNFTLRSIYTRPDDHAEDTLLGQNPEVLLKIQYEPGDLDRLDRETVNRLGYFKQAFMFMREDLDGFLRALSDAVKGQEDLGGSGKDEAMGAEG
ncbi:hypothetical protein L226DRAFT_567611 [Lentinus tigrinus ALCF2SS1-7]|nr:hypothetical protein L226DRAFT_567611 [Lentinus tigrinus ALCF2SS1-7]